MIMLRITLAGLVLMLISGLGFITPAAVDAGDVPVKGRWVSISTRGVYYSTTSSGELIAVDEGALYLYSLRRVRRIPRETIVKISMEKQGPTGGKVFLWTLLGTLSTPSHGIILILTAPLWLVVGTTTSIVVGLTNDEAFPIELWGQLSNYSRFPQGLPEGFYP